MNTRRPPIHSLTRGQAIQHERGAVAVAGEIVGYEMLTVDARSSQQRKQDRQRGMPGGHIMVIVPGHGQTIHGPRKLVTMAAHLSKSGIAWCIDPVPASGGDRVEAQAIGRVVRERLAISFPNRASSVKAALIGWSHGGGEALRAATDDPVLFPQYLGLCPTGCVERQPLEFVVSFIRESLRILRDCGRSRDWICLSDTLRVGANAVMGLLKDLGRSRSPRRLVEDIEWATRKVTGTSQSYSGEIVLLFGEQDTVIRWADAFPSCDRPDQIESSTPIFQQENFPCAEHVTALVVPGAHIAPESHAPSFLQLGLSELHQLHQAG